MKPEFEKRTITLRGKPARQYRLYWNRTIYPIQFMFHFYVKWAALLIDIYPTCASLTFQRDSR